VAFPATETDIANMALAMLKQTKRIGQLRTEKTTEAALVLAFYDNTLAEVQRLFDWPCFTKIQPLALVAQLTGQEYGYAYRYPNGCLNFRKIQSGFRVPTTDTAVPWRIAADDQGLLIYTDMANAVGEWTFFQSNTSLFFPDFVAAFAAKLAWYVAPGLTGSDPYKLRSAAEDAFAKAMLQASVNAANEQQRDPPPPSGAEIAREGYQIVPGFPKAT
jgi:hypothetical protein